MTNKKSRSLAAFKAPVALPLSSTLPSLPELVSAMVDGQLDGHELKRVLTACAQGDVAIRSWHAYHLIGDILRMKVVEDSHAGAAGADIEFVDRLQRRMLLETEHGATPLVLQTPSYAQLPASNDNTFRWKLVAGFASLAAVSAIAWSMVSELSAIPAAQLASSNAPQFVVLSPQGPMVRDPRLEELLAAHSQLGGASALQESSRFFRNAIFEARQDGRDAAAP